MNEKPLNARYRRITTSIHDDEWFKCLSPGARNLYLNLIPSVGTSGAHIASVGWLAKRAGFDNSIIPMWLAKIITKRHLEQLVMKVIYWPDDEVVWIKNFTQTQGVGKKFVSGAIKHAHNFPAHIRDVIINELEPNEHTKENGAIAQKDTLSDGLTDTAPDTHAHVTEEQSSRVAEEQNNSTHSLTVRESDIKILIKTFTDKFPNAPIRDNDNKAGSSIWNTVTDALHKQPLDHWMNVITKASESAFLTGKETGQKKTKFNPALGWMLSVEVSNKILAGGFDSFQRKSAGSEGRKF